MPALPLDHTPPAASKFSSSRIQPLTCFITYAAPEPDGSATIGSAVAHRFAQEGARLVLTDEPDTKDDLIRVAKEASMAGASRIFIHAAELTEASKVEESAQAALSTFGAVDVLVLVPPTRGSDFVTTAASLLQALLPRMRENHMGYVIGLLKTEDEKMKRLLQDTAKDMAEEEGIEVVRFCIPEDAQHPTGRSNLVEQLLSPFIKRGGEETPVSEALAGLRVGEEGQGRWAHKALVKRVGPDELVMADTDTPGAILTSASPQLLEPEFGHVYENEPKRDPRLLVQCLEPFNGETPHVMLAEGLITPSSVFFVRNHLPVPTMPDDPSTYRITIDGSGVSALSLTLDELKAQFPSVTITATVQCAGNRRADAAAVDLVEGRSPWNAGGIGNARWTGVRLRDVLISVFNSPASLDDLEAFNPQHVIFRGRDRHAKSQLNFESSIPLANALDPRGDVLLAYEMNGEPLLTDHGYPLRVIIPGFVGARMVKWLQHITLSETESQAPWMQKDYKLLPPFIKDHIAAKPWLATVPPIMALSVQSAILVPSNGAVFPPDTPAIEVKGYAWSGGGHSIIRVEVSGDGGKSNWMMANITHRESQPEDKAWSWVLWEALLPTTLADAAGRIEICCRAFDRSCNTQPEQPSSIWNHRGLCTK